MTDIEYILTLKNYKKPVSVVTFDIAAGNSLAVSERQCMSITGRQTNHLSYCIFNCNWTSRDLLVTGTCRHPHYPPHHHYLFLLLMVVKK